MKYGKATQAVVLLAFVKRALCCIFLDPIFSFLMDAITLETGHKVCILPAMSICIKYTILRFLKGCPCLLAFWHYTSLKCAGAFKVPGMFSFWKGSAQNILDLTDTESHPHLLWPFCDSNYQHNEHATRQQVFNSKSSWHPQKQRILSSPHRSLQITSLSWKW